MSCIWFTFQLKPTKSCIMLLAPRPSVLQLMRLSLLIKFEDNIFSFCYIELMVLDILRLKVWLFFIQDAPIWNRLQNVRLTSTAVYAGKSSLSVIMYSGSTHQKCFRHTVIILWDKPVWKEISITVVHSILNVEGSHLHATSLHLSGVVPTLTTTWLYADINVRYIDLALSIVPR